jgi:hypothetical protein
LNPNSGTHLADQRQRNEKNGDTRWLVARIDHTSVHAALRRNFRSVSVMDLCLSLGRTGAGPEFARMR